jgi:hypothetical protein
VEGVAVGWWSPFRVCVRPHFEQSRRSMTVSDPVRFQGDQACRHFTPMRTVEALVPS